MKKILWVCFVLVSTKSFAQDIYVSPLSKFSAGTKKITSISFSDDSQWISVADEKNIVSLRKVGETTPTKQFSFTGSVAIQEFIDGGKKFLTLDKTGKLWIYEVGSFTESVSTPLAPNIKEACLDPTHQYLTSFNKDNQIEIFDLKTGMTLGRMPRSRSSKKCSLPRL
ncbi:MAG: hypothetical protein QM734_10770 [Cyclobacteriaceae bacterium]